MLGGLLGVKTYMFESKFNDKTFNVNVTIYLPTETNNKYE